MTAICDIKDLQKRARRRVPRMFYEYADSGSWTQSTYRANEADFHDILLRQRVAVDPGVSCVVRGFHGPEQCPSCLDGLPATCTRAGDEGPTIVAHEDAAMRSNIEEMVKARKAPRRRRSLVGKKSPRPVLS